MIHIAIIKEGCNIIQPMLAQVYNHFLALESKKLFAFVGQNTGYIQKRRDRASIVNQRHTDFL